jgi:hypothetical protein
VENRIASKSGIYKYFLIFIFQISFVFRREIFA